MRVLVVDDHALFRKGVIGLIDPLDDMEVVGEAGDGHEALEKAMDLMPDLILMDIQMPGWNGLETTRQIKGRMPYVKIVMLTISGEDEDLFEAVKSGAQGYLLKGINPQELVDLLRGVHRGEAPISRLSAAKILEEFSRLADKGGSGPEARDVLTPREREVLQLVVQGETNKGIAAELTIAENTVKNHLSNILAKLHLRSRAQAAAYAVREQLLEAPRVED